MWEQPVVTGLANVAQANQQLNTIGDVITRLEQTGVVLAGLKKEGLNPVRAFNDLYLRITKEVDSGLKGTAFLDAPFMEQLDIEFARLYFRAIDDWIAGDPVPTAWRYLFLREDGGVLHSNLEGALLGVNAHINHDLKNALVNADALLGQRPGDLTNRRTDFDRINDIFASEVGPIMQELVGTLKSILKRWLWKAIDKLFGSLDDLLILQLIARSRTRAWNQAESVWTAGPEAIDPNPSEQNDLSGWLAAVIAGSPLFMRVDNDLREPLLNAEDHLLRTENLQIKMIETNWAVVSNVTDLELPPADPEPDLVNRVVPVRLFRSVKTAAERDPGDLDFQRLADDLPVNRFNPIVGPPARPDNPGGP